MHALYVFVYCIPRISYQRVTFKLNMHEVLAAFFGPLVLIAANLSHYPTAILEVSSLPPQITTDEIEAYFEGQGDNIEIQSTVNLGSRNARVVLSGISAEGMTSGMQAVKGLCG